MRISHTSSPVAKTSSAAGERFHPQDGFIYFLLSGQITLAVNDPDNLLGIVIEHMPLGLLEHYCPAVELLYQCLDRCRFARISVEDFERIFFYSSPEYMKELTTILAYMGILLLMRTTSAATCPVFRP